MLLQKMECDYLSSLGEQIMEAVARVQDALGDGGTKEEYLDALARELELREVPYVREVWQAEEVAGAPLNVGYVLDMVVDNKLVLDIFVAPETTREDNMRLLNMLALSRRKLGFSINFGARHAGRGIQKLYYEEQPQQN